MKIVTKCVLNNDVFGCILKIKLIKHVGGLKSGPDQNHKPQSRNGDGEGRY